MPVRRLRPPDMRRVVIVVPSAFTLGNMFFGMWAMVNAFRGTFMTAAWFIMFAGVLDMLDGRVARLSGTGTKFGAELDSLVDLVSFGVAPAMIMFFLEFQAAGKFGWLICYMYVVGVAIRLARYNVQHGTGKPGWFTGMPSPSAGMTLAVFYPFSQTPWYQQSLAYLNFQREGLTVLMVLLSLLMVSTVQYPRLPGIGFRSAKGLMGLALHVIILTCALLFPSKFLFPLGVSYLAFGLLRHAFLLVFERGDGTVAVVARDEVVREDSDEPRQTTPRITTFRRRADD
ncbi:MAG TPA: CDP-diacylglycerol--serine O-phosphatidyltransferase [Gemmatimonadales bacterium]|nr:CDP-diacylglycerol--serine O-phosphatidyltransferase [Gemmatimonadales bacterium]